MTDDFAPIARVAEVMSDFAHPWWVAGGWAIDLFIGRVTRAHGDVEISAYRDTQGALHQHLSRFKLAVAVDACVVAWAEDEELAPSLFQILATDPSLPAGELQVFLDDRADGQWICRRDPRIRRPCAEVTLPAPDRFNLGPTRYLAPEIQLLFKGKHAQLEKNEADFAAALPLLSSQQRLWLRASLAQVHPGHAWLSRL